MPSENSSESIALVAYVDGACRGNPGPAGCAAVLMCDNEVILKAGKYLGESTNNRAEYHGLLLALTRASEFQNCRRLKVFTDSQLMARQINGRYKIKDAELQRLKKQADELIAGFDHFEIEDIRRNKNKDADEMANKAIDTGLAEKKQNKK